MCTRIVGKRQQQGVRWIDGLWLIRFADVLYEMQQHKHDSSRAFLGREACASHRSINPRICNEYLFIRIQSHSATKPTDDQESSSDCEPRGGAEGRGHQGAGGPPRRTRAARSHGLHRQGPQGDARRHGRRYGAAGAPCGARHAQGRGGAASHGDAGVERWRRGERGAGQQGGPASCFVGVQGAVRSRHHGGLHHAERRGGGLLLYVLQCGGHVIVWRK